MFTVKKRRFVEEYLIDANATRAAKRAGYSERTAYSQGQRLLKDVDVKQKLEEAQQARSERIIIKQDEVLKEIGVLSFSSVNHYLIDDLGNVTMPQGVSDEAMRAVSSIKRRVTHRGRGEDKEVTYETEIKLWDKPAALQMAGRHLGIFVDKVAPTTPDGKEEYSGSLTDEERANRVVALLERGRTRRDRHADSPIE